MGNEKLEEKRIPISELFRGPSEAHAEVSLSGVGRKTRIRRRGSEDPKRNTGVVERAFEESESSSGEQNSGGVVVGERPGTGSRYDRDVLDRLQTSSASLPTIKFKAVLAVNRKFLAIDNDGEAQVILDVPANYLPEIMKLVLFRGKSFKVEINANN